MRRLPVPMLVFTPKENCGWNTVFALGESSSKGGEPDGHESSRLGSRASIVVVVNPEDSGYWEKLETN